MGNSYNADHAHADSHRIVDHEFVLRESVPRASMPIYSGISTFSVEPTVAIDELSQDVTFIEDIRDKYHRPNNIRQLLVPTVNASI